MTYIIGSMYSEHLWGLMDKINFLYASFSMSTQNHLVRAIFSCDIIPLYKLSWYCDKLLDSLGILLKCVTQNLWMEMLTVQ